MVGLKDLGEAAWSIEQVLNLWLRQEQEVTPGETQAREAIGHQRGRGDVPGNAQAGDNLLLAAWHYRLAYAMAKAKDRVDLSAYLKVETGYTPH